MMFKDSKHPCWANLNAEGLALFGDIFPNGMVPVQGLQTGITKLGVIGENEIRFVALDVLDPDTRERLLEKVARHFLPEASAKWESWVLTNWINQAKREIEHNGLPLRESLVGSWVLKDPQRWID